MRTRSFCWVVLVAAIVAACQGTVTPSGSATVAPVSPRPGSSAASASAGPSKAPGTADLFGTRYAAKAGPDGGSIVIGDVREANQFHPYFVTEDSDARVASAAWSTLVLHTPDDRYLPDLATGIPTLGNGVDVPGEAGDAMTVHWTLRPNLKWSDGEPLTCDDMKYAWEWVNDPQNVGVSQGGFENIKAFECASATDMTWHFDRVYAGYLTLLTAPLPRHYLAAIPMSDQTAGAGFRAAELAKIPVSGPFMFESATPGGELRMVRNANYAGPASGKPAHLGRLTWRWFADAKSLIAGYRNGDVDVATGLRDVDAASAANLAKQVSTIPSLAYELLRPNWSPTTCSTSVAVAGRGPGCPISDPAIRRAVQLTISRNDLNERLYGGALEVTDGNVPRTSWFFAGPPALVFDPAKARAILDAAGWVAGPTGMRTHDGLKATVELCTASDPTREAALAIIVSRLADIGIAGVVNAVPPAEIFADDDGSPKPPPCAISRGNYDLAAVSSTEIVDPLAAFFRYHSSQVSPNGANDGAVTDPSIDAALETVQTTADFGVMRGAMADFQRLYGEQVVEMPLYSRTVVELHVPKLGNFAANAFHGGVTWNVADWFLSR